VQVDDAAQLVRNSVNLVNPNLADAIPDSALRVAVGISQSTPVDRLMSTAELAGWLALPFAAVGAGCFVASIRRSPNPRRATETVGVCLVGLGVVTFAILAIGVNVFAGLGADDRERTALRAVFWSMTHLLNLEAKALITAGAVLAVAAAYSGTGRLTKRVDDVLHVARVRLKEPAWRAAGCTGLIGAGLFAAVWPTVTAEVLIRLLAFAVFVVGAAGLLDLVGSYQWGAIVDPRVRYAARRVAVASVGATTCLVIVVLFGGLSFARALRAPTTGHPAMDETGCNGHIELCDRALDEVAFVGTHNAMAGSQEDGWFFRNQSGGLAAQLGSGVRAFMLDLHYGARAHNVVRTDFLSESEEELSAAQLSTEARAVLAGTLAIAGAAPPEEAREVYLCHVYCELGATLAVDAFRDVDSFLRENPNEVLIVILEDHVEPADAIDALERGGLGDRAFAWNPGSPLPTLREMIEAERNVLVLVENGGASSSWYQPAYDDILQETPYRFETIDGFSCERNRGPAAAPLLLVNHWLASDPPSTRLAELVNSPGLLGARAEECQSVRRRLPNILAVDFYNRGDVFEVVDRLNDLAD
jgi:hypothetical protein